MASNQPTHQEVIDATAAAEATMRPQRVPVNVYETTGALVVVAPMPAVTAADVSIELSDASLRFWARLRTAGPRDYLVNEWDYGGGAGGGRRSRRRRGGAGGGRAPVP